MKRIYSMKSGVMDKVKGVFEYMQHKYFLNASASIGGAFVAIFEWIAQNPQTAIYFLFFGGVALAGKVLKMIHDSKVRKAERIHTEKLRVLELKRIEQELNQDQDKHKKDLQNE